MNLYEKIESLLSYINRECGTDFADLTSAIRYVVENGVQIEIPTIDISEIQSYFHDEITSALSYVDGLSGYTHYVCSTDNHYNVNKFHSAIIQNYLMQTGKFDKIIILGDIVDSGAIDDERYQKFISDSFNLMNGKILLVTGNHDSSLDKQTVFNDFMSKANVVFDTSSKSWYYDKAMAKIRIIGIDFYSATAIPEAFLTSAVSGLPTGYAYAICMHYTLQSANSNWDMCWGSNVEEKLLNIVNNNANKSFIGFFTGHQHIDETVKLSNNAYHSTFLCDKFENYPYYDYYNYPTRTEGTDTEQAITIISINPTTKDVRFYRIGACNDDHKTWGYTYEQITSDNGGTDTDDPQTPTLKSDDTEWNSGVSYTLNIVDDKYYDTDGTVTNYDGWFLAEPVYCKGAKCLYFSTSVNGKYCIFYDEDKNYIKNITNEFVAGASSLIGYACNIPDNAAYFGFSSDNSKKSIIITPYDRVYDTDMD